MPIHRNYTVSSRKQLSHMDYKSILTIMFTRYVTVGDLLTSLPQVPISKDGIMIKCVKCFNICNYSEQYLHITSTVSGRCYDN